MSKRAVAMVLLASILILFGFTHSGLRPGRAQDNEAFHPDSWISPYSEWPQSTAKEPVAVPDRLVVPVSESSVPSACRLLATRDWVELTSSEAQVFLNGAHPRVNDRLRPFLVRAVTSGAGTEVIQVYVNKRDLVIDGGALSHYTLTLRHRPLIVYLSLAPKRVLLTYTVAE